MTAKRVLVFGGGTPSTALLVLSVLGERGVPRADVGFYPSVNEDSRETYQHLHSMVSWAEKRGFPLVVLGKPGLRDALETGMVVTPSVREPGAVALPTCARVYKAEPVREFARREFGASLVEAMLPVPFDQILRMKPTGLALIENTYPLIDARLTAKDCAAVLAEHGIAAPPDSGCVFCPHKGTRFLSECEGVCGL